jgi:hypothetical protein
MTDFSLAHTVRHIRQPSTNSCWAASIAMARGQLGGRPATVHRVQEVARQAGVQLARNGSLPSGNPSNMTTLAQAVGMRCLGTRGMSFNVARMLERLRPGPVILFGTFIYQGRTRRLTDHALVITGMFGDGTNTGTAITLVDPFDGRDYNFSWQDFGRNVVGRLDFVFYRAGMSARGT